MGKINFELLEMARLLRQQTQAKAAEAIGISQAKLSKAEKGLQEMSEEYLSRLCAFYDLPATFFFRDKDASPISHMYFRRKITVSSKIIDAFLAKVKIMKMIIDDMMSAVELPEYTLGSYTPDDRTTIQDIADKIRYKLGIHNGPMPNLTALLENNGIIIVKFDFGTDKLDGLSTITNKGYKIIFLNNTMSNDRIRYSLAHELGHIIMHLDTPPEHMDTVEDQANDFASQLLLPKEEIRPLLYNLNLRTLAELKRRWRVSMRALIRRAWSLGVIDKNVYRGFQIVFSRNGYNKCEPVSLPIETATLLSNTLKLYKEELAYTDDDIMSIMTLKQNDYHDLFCVKPNAPIISLQRRI